jgi:hypothetical protein
MSFIRTEPTQEIFNQICTEIAGATCGLRSILDKYNVSVGSFYNFKDETSERREQYARAYQIKIHMMADDMIDVANDKSEDTLEGEFGKTGNNAAVGRAKLIIDTNKWLLAKTLPKEYGDKIEVNANTTTTQVFKIGDTEIAM